MGFPFRATAITITITEESALKIDHCFQHCNPFLLTTTTNHCTSKSPSIAFCFKLRSRGFHLQAVRIIFDSLNSQSSHGLGFSFLWSQISLTKFSHAFFAHPIQKTSQIK
jgi:hypothetical protein